MSGVAVHPRPGVPPRLKRWIYIWIPVAWVVLELATYPKDNSLAVGWVRILKGFFSSSVAAYPAWVVLTVGLLVTGAGAAGLVRQRKGRRFPLAVLVVGLELLVWGVWAAGLPASFKLAGHACSVAWLWQTAVLVTVGACVWVWAQTNPERAELMVWNGRQIWKLYRANWQGMVGLYIIIFFAAIALLAPFLADHHYLSPTSSVGPAFSGPTSDYYRWFGTTELGQSVLAEWIWSTRISLVVGLMATVISTVLGAAIGIAAGYYGRWMGETLMRLTDAFLVIPWLPLAMVMAAAWGTNYLIIMLIIGITSWPGTARVVRSQTLAVRELPFIERAKAIGSSDWHIMSKHILPNVFPLIFANTVLVVAIAILSETTLSFLGLGDPLRFSWGTMLHYVWASGGSNLPSTRMYVLAPGLAIVAVVVAFTFMGTAFDEVLDPKLRKREESEAGPERLTGGSAGGETALAGGPGGGAVALNAQGAGSSASKPGGVL